MWEYQTTNLGVSLFLELVDLGMFHLKHYPLVSQMGASKKFLRQVAVTSAQMEDLKADQLKARKNGDSVGLHVLRLKRPRDNWELTKCSGTKIWRMEIILRASSFVMLAVREAKMDLKSCQNSEMHLSIHTQDLLGPKVAYLNRLLLKQVKFRPDGSEVRGPQGLWWLLIVCQMSSQTRVEWNLAKEALPAFLWRISLPFWDVCKVFCFFFGCFPLFCFVSLQAVKNKTTEPISVSLSKLESLRSPWIFSVRQGARWILVARLWVKKLGGKKMRKRRWLDFLLGTLFWGNEGISQVGWRFVKFIHWFTLDGLMIYVWFTCGIDIAWHHLISYVISSMIYFFISLVELSWQKTATTFKPPGGCRSGSRTTLGHLFSGWLGWGIPSLDFEVWKLTIELGSPREVVEKSSANRFFFSVCCFCFYFCFCCRCRWWYSCAFKLKWEELLKMLKLDEGFLAEKTSMSGDGFLNSKSKQMPKDISPLQNLCTPWAYNILHEHHHICNMPWGFKRTAVTKDITWV